MSVIAVWLYCMDYFQVGTTVINFINLFHVRITLIYLFILFTSGAQQTLL